MDIYKLSQNVSLSIDPERFLPHLQKRIESEALQNISYNALIFKRELLASQTTGQQSAMTYRIYS
jgi:hypothetical protein